MKKNLILVSLLIILSVYSFANETEINEITEISAEWYWYNKMFYNETSDFIEEDEVYFYGEYSNKHGHKIKYKVRKDLLHSSEAKNKASIKGLEVFISSIEILEADEYKDIQSALMNNLYKKLRQLTEVDFDDINDWRNWFEENRDYLFYSDDKEKILVDENAKKAGVSVLKER